MFVFLCRQMLYLLLILFFFCIVLQVSYAVYVFIPEVYSSYTAGAGNALPGSNEQVSVIICARNEARNLQQNLPFILAQRYSNAAGKRMFEVIVVDDASTDDTGAVLAALCLKYDHLRVVQVKPQEQRSFPGKKYAVSKGVAAADNDWLLFTDADCIPASDRWIDQMSAVFRNSGGRVKIAGSYGKYSTGPGMLNAFIRWETMHSFLQAFTYARSGMPYMAVGRNLAVNKELYAQVQDWDVWKALPTGDDDLLVARTATAENMRMIHTPESFTISEPKHSWGEWWRQKQRHLSAGKYYRQRIKAYLGAYALTHTLSWLLFFVLLCTGPLFWAVPLMVFRCGVYWYTWARMCRLLGEKNLMKWFPLFDLGWMIYNFAFAPYIFWKNKQQWK
jgi:glycosyltransferase involved in cell wall biosynthesis